MSTDVPRTIDRGRTPGRYRAADPGKVDPRLFARIRHELRTSLNTITGYSEMLLEDIATPGGESRLARLEEIHAAGARLLARVDDVVDPAQGDTTLLALETLGTSMRRELRATIDGIIEHSEWLLNDAARLGQEDTIADLGRIHAAGKRFLTLIDELANAPRSGAREMAFEQAAASRSVLSGGVACTAGSRQEEGGATPLGQGKVLVVDDNDLNRDLLSRRLKRQGHAVAVAINGGRALEMLRAERFDLVLLDVLMPETNGYQVLRQLKADAALRDIPVIIISALDEIDSVVRCIELGAEDYLPKPFNPVLLRARIGACLEKKRLRDQEVAYLRDVARVTTAAAAVESGAFEPEQLDAVAARPDALGKLAHVFQRMGREVRAREERLQRQVQELRIQVDEVKKAREVAEITQTDYFRALQDKAGRLRTKG
jgi:DNA-binding response OmpR family regulator